MDCLNFPSLPPLFFAAAAGRAVNGGGGGLPPGYSSPTREKSRAVGRKEEAPPPPLFLLFSGINTGRKVSGHSQVCNYSFEPANLGMCIMKGGDQGPHAIEGGRIAVC